MIKDVFAPLPGEKVLFLVDVPQDNLKDSDIWRDRRDMAQEWYNSFKKLSEKEGFTVEILEYTATGMHNAPLEKDVVDAAKK